MRPSQRPALRSHLDARTTTSWMRWMSSLCCAPYLSQTGFTASWNGFLSAILMTSTPFALMSASAFLHLVPKLALLLLRFLGELRG